jgi:hypothetical protein
MVEAIFQFPTRLRGFHRNNFTFSLLLFGSEFVYIRSRWSWLEETQQYINGPRSSYLWDTFWGESRPDAHTSYCPDYQWPLHKRHSCPYCCPIYTLKYCTQVSVYLFITVVHQYSSTKIHGVTSRKVSTLMYDRWSLCEIRLKSVSSSISKLRFAEQGPRSLLYRTLTGLHLKPILKCAYAQRN